MMKRFALVAASVALVAFAVARPSVAQSDFERRLHAYHVECDRGDRRACIRFGMMLGESRERHVEWRRSHPDWWWWER